MSPPSKSNDISAQAEEGLKPIQFHSPTSIAIFAPPYSGKSTLTRKILENSDKLFTRPPKFVVYCYNENLPMLDDMKESLKIPLIKHKGIPTTEEMESWSQTKEHFIIVLDDLQQACERERKVADMFTVGSHHLDFTVIYLCHNIFGRGTFSRTINLNSHYIILFRNFRDQQQVVTLGRQMFGKKNKYFMDAYEKATKKPYGYLLINNHPTMRDERYRLVSQITPDQDTVIYLPRE